MIFFCGQRVVLNLSCMLESLNGANSNERGSSVVARLKNSFQNQHNKLIIHNKIKATQVVCNQWVGGSSPSIGTSFKPLVFQGFLFYLAYLIHHKNSIFIPF